MEIQGTFNAARFSEVLAGILSRKYGADITVEKLIEKREEGQK